MSPYLGHVWNGEFLCQMTISKLFMSGLMLFWGRVGKLSIKVPWKKFGWEPIIIALEDVFICLCQREDSEWSSDSMERRELAGKMAKLNAIELAKFSRRVSDNPAGQSFLSYIYAKALDNIQVSIRNVHIIYSDSHNDLGKFIFGLRFSTLTIMTDTRKKNSTLPIIGKSRSAQVNKIVEISDVGLYCNLLEGSLHSLIHTIESQLLCDEKCDYLINPFDVSVSLVVNKSGKLDGSPQYAIITELTTLVVSLNEILLEQILGLCDNLSICKLREKYGRYRPPQISLAPKLNGWQILWWHYAQESVLADVRQKLKKTSWKNLGRRIYVICNACSKDLCYRQKGTNAFYHLGVGQHSHLHWSDTTRELYISIRFNERGWQWSGSFLPDCLGDVQVKMHNYVSGTSNMVRVEVQNADMSICDKRMRNSTTNSSQLIVLSDDKTGFTPYRIDNFTMEKLRIYQQKCEPFETTIHAYASSEYAWDEPCYPHRLVIEVPGERILGTYTLDNIQEYVPVSLPSTPEKPERSLHVSIRAEGATKVLSIIDSSHHVVDGTKESSLLVSKGKSKGDQKQSCHGSFGEVVTLHFPFIGISLINSYPQELVFASMKDTTLTVMQSSDQQEISFQILSVQIDNQLSDTPYPIMLSFDNENKGRSASFRKNKEYKLRIGDHSAGACASESTCDSVLYMAAAKWRNADASLISFKYINLRLAPLCIELEEQVFLSLLDFFRAVSSRLRSRSLQKDSEMQNLDYGTGASRQPSINDMDHKHGQNNLSTVSRFVDYNKYSQLLPSVIPIGAPWQQIYLSARRQRKIYVEVFELAPIRLSFSFSSTPWMIRNEEVESLTQISTTFQRGLMALVDVEGVPVHLGELMLEHIMASHDSIQEIVVRHYTRQLLHEIYKVLGSAGVIGNPMGFARNVGLAIKDFFSVSSRGIVQSPVGLVTGILEGSKSLVSNTVYAVSSATTQFSKAAHKGIVAFTFDEQAVAEMDVQLKGLESNGKGLLNEFLEGLTGLLQSPIRGAEKHGLPGILSGIAMGTAGLVARPMASIFEATGKTAQSIRNRSSPHVSKRLRVRLPRPLSRELPLSPYSWEEAVGVSMLLQADGFRLKDETFVLCKALKQAGKFIILSEKLVFIVYCSCLVGLGSPEFVGVAAKPEWVIETAMSLESIVHVDRTEDTVSIVGSSAETMSKQKKTGTRNTKFWSAPTSPLFYMRAELPNCEVAEDLLQVLLSTIEQGKERRWGMHVLHRSNLR